MSHFAAENYRCQIQMTVNFGVRIIANTNNTSLILFSKYIKKEVPKLSTLPLFVTKQKLQLCEILNGANHLRSIRILVVIPGNNLNLIKTVAKRGNHCLSSVKQ